MINVRDFGATPNDATDDTDAINRAIQSAGARWNGSASAPVYVYFPAGTYIINSKPDYSYVDSSGATRWVIQNNPIRTASGVVLTGDGARASVLQMPPDVTNRAIVVIGNQDYDRVTNPLPPQEDIVIDSLGFDLVNGVGRQAIQLRFPAQNVRVNNCDGFQSGDWQNPPPVKWRDNQFFNMACIGPSQNIEVSNCVVSGHIQLTSDGLYGIQHLHIHDNTVTDAVSYGIAVTTVAVDASEFSDIDIENNTILNASACGIYIGPDYSATRTYDFTSLTDAAGKPRIFRTDGIYVRNNTIAGSASGISVGPMLFGTTDVEVTGNFIIGLDSAGSALAFNGWDLNWSRQGIPTIPLSCFNAATGTIVMPNDADGTPRPHRLLTGMLIQLFPATSSDQLPPQIRPFDYYKVERVSDSEFALRTLSGAPVAFTSPPHPGNFSFAFKPAIQGAIIANNTIEGSWNESLFLTASIDFNVSGNIFPSIDSNQPSNLRLTAEHHHLIFSNNVGVGLLSTWWQWSGTSLFDCQFTGNVWMVDESLPGFICCGTSAAVTFNPNDQRRQMNYTFANNTIDILHSDSSNPTSINGVRDFGATGTIRASYLDNRINPATRGYDCDPQNVLYWSNNVGANLHNVPENPPKS